MTNPFSNFEAVVFTLLMIILLVVLFTIWFNVFCPPRRPTREDEMAWDFLSCEQMRASGWTEKEIKDFMDTHDGYYDKDYNLN